MEHAYTVQGAFLLLGAVSGAGSCGLLMFRAMLLSPTPSSLRREAVSSIMKQESFCYLNSHQQEAVFRALYAFEPPPERSTLPALSPGFQAQLFTE